MRKVLSRVPGAEYLINITLHYYYYFKRVILVFFVAIVFDVQILIFNLCSDDLLPGNYDF